MQTQRPRRRRGAAAVLVALAVGLGAPTGAHAATFTPVADAYVDASSPATNFGGATSLRVDSDPVRTAYLRFDVQGVGSATSAVLRVFAETSNSVGFDVRSVSDNAWGETTITSNNAPAAGSVIASSGPVTGGNWYSVNVSPAVAGNGLVSFAITSTSSTATRYSNREGANPAQLTVPAPAPSTSFTVTRNGNSSVYQAVSPNGTTHTGTLKSVVESAIGDLRAAGGGTITFAAGVFDLGDSWFKLENLSNVTFQGQGIGATTIQNSSSQAADTEPFNTSTTHNVVIRDMTVFAGGPFRSTSDAIDMDGGNNDLIERVRVTGSRGRGIVFDGKDIVGGQPRTADGNTIRNCEVTAVPSDGIEMLAARSNRIEGCTITDVAGHGIQLTKASTGASQPNKQSNDNTLTGNVIDNSGQDGINLNSAARNQIVGNTVLNSSDDVSSRDGIRIGASDSITCDDNVVSNNTSSDNQAVHTQRYGLHISSSLCNRTVVGANTFSGNRVAPIRDLGTGTIFQ